MKKRYSLFIGILLVFLGAIAYYVNLQNGKIIHSRKSGEEMLIGSDRDEHGCIGTAGYIWCEEKQKCLRPWEEVCEEGRNAKTSTDDEISLLEASIKQALVAKYGPDASSLTVVASKTEGAYAQGSAAAEAGGGMWFATKKSGTWELVWDGNGIILCTDLSSYPDFPATMIPECYDESSNTIITR